ncbi:MAG TPA: hypothetical protein VIH42_10895, partial [Thermoguttaceae bacterium]
KWKGGEGTGNPSLISGLQNSKSHRDIFQNSQPPRCQIGLKGHHTRAIRLKKSGLLDQKVYFNV